VIINIILNIISDLQGRLLDQAITDPLTGAFNRRHMESCLGDAIERNRRTNSPASVLLIDVDHFKNINDRFGHEAGDSVLKSIVSLIDKRSRRLDLLFRMGGEEFLLFLSDTRSIDAVRLAEQLRASVAKSHMLADWPLSVSIGVSELRPGESLDSWIKHADSALYMAKETGRNRVVSREYPHPKTQRFRKWTPVLDRIWNPAVASVSMWCCFKQARHPRRAHFTRREDENPSFQFTSTPRNRSSRPACSECSTRRWTIQGQEQTNTDYRNFAKGHPQPL